MSRKTTAPRLGWADVPDFEWTGLTTLASEFTMMRMGVKPSELLVLAGGRSL